MCFCRHAGSFLKWQRYRAVVLAVCTIIAISQSACVRNVSLQNSSRYQAGQASWYGEKFQNKRTASGEKFDMQKLTAAHRTLPFNTVVRVINMNNGRNVKVRINDRGPFIEGRIIDLSRKAAEKLDMVRAGVAPVRIEILN